MDKRIAWLESRKLSKGQRVQARVCDLSNLKSRHGTLVEGTIIEDTDGMFEVFDIDCDGEIVLVFYPEKILT